MLKAIFGGFLAAIGAILAYMVYLRLKSKKIAPQDTVIARTPGEVGNLNSVITGFFDTGKGLSVPPTIGPFGNVGEPVYGSDGFTPVPLDLNVPSFLVGATGGVQDPKMIGKAPPIIPANPGVCGGKPWSAQYQMSGLTALKN
jgi:hypothetical protein